MPRCGLSNASSRDFRHFPARRVTASSEEGVQWVASRRTAWSRSTFYGDRSTGRRTYSTLPSNAMSRSTNHPRMARAEKVTPGPLATGTRWLATVEPQGPDAA